MAAKPISNVTSDPLCFTRERPSVPVKDGPISDAIVVLAEPPKGEHRVLDPVRFRFANCQLRPYAAVILVGQRLVVRNDSALFHTVQMDGARRESHALPRKGSHFSRRFDHPVGLVRLKDLVHPDLEAHLLVVDHPYFAVTDDKGAFELGGPPLPDGRYAVRVWHPMLGESIRWIHVKSGVQTVDWRIRAEHKTAETHASGE